MQGGGEKEEEEKREWKSLSLFSPSLSSSRFSDSFFGYGRGGGGILDRSRVGGGRGDFSRRFCSC